MDIRLKVTQVIIAKIDDPARRILEAKLINKVINLAIVRVSLD